MKTAPFEYHKALSVTEALEMLATTADARVMAGGQSLLPLMHQRLARPAHVVDVNNIDALRDVSEDANSWCIGAGTTASQIEDGVISGRVGEFLSEVSRGVACRGIRNVGTLGGNLAFADPGADWPAALALVGAEIIVQSAAGTRQLMVDELITGAFNTCLANDELIVQMRVPKLSSDANWCYFKHHRKFGDPAHAIAATLIDPAGDRKNIVLSATDDKPLILSELANSYLTNNQPVSRNELLLLITEHRPQLDEYKRHMLGVVLERAINALMRR